MKLYDDNKNEIVIESSKINFGKCSEIYKYKDKCVKIYYDACLENNRIGEQEFKTLKNIESDNFVKLYKLIYENKKISGYIMKYYEEEKLEILKKEMKYILFQMEEIKKLIDVISNEKIIVDDMKRDNVIYTNNNIIIIDPDLFYKTDTNIRKIKYTNYKELLKLFKQMFLVEAHPYLKNGKHPNPYYILDELFDFNIDSNIIDNFYRKTKNYKYPIDYFISKK